MNLKNSKKWCSVPRPLAYGASLLITLAAFAFRYLVHDYVQPYIPFQPFFLACLLIEYFFGLGPAILSAVLALILGMHYFIEPYGVINGISVSDIIVSLNFILTTLLTIAIIEYLRRTLYSNQLWLKIANSRHRTSLLRENDRLYFAKKASAAASAVERLVKDLSAVLVIQSDQGASYPQPLCYRLCERIRVDANGSGWLELFHPDDIAQLQDALQSREGMQETRRDLTLRMRSPEGEYLPTQILLERLSVGHSAIMVIKLTELSTFSI